MRNFATLVLFAWLGYGCGSDTNETANGGAGTTGSNAGSNTAGVDASMAAGGTSGGSDEDAGSMVPNGNAGTSSGGGDDLAPPGDGVIAATIIIDGVTGTIVCPMTLIVVGENMDISDRVGGDSCERMPEDTHVAVGNFPVVDATSIEEPAYFEFEVGGPGSRIFSADVTEYSFTIESHDPMAGTLQAEMHVVAPNGEAHLWINKQ